MEQQPGPVNWAPYNPSPQPGMVKLWTWEAIAHGAEVVSYFRWRQLPFAQEQMHSGLLKHDSSAAAALSEVKEIADLIHKFRGGIEGGVIVRQIESYLSETETRYFVFNGKPYGPKGTAPQIVHNIAARIDAPFYSVDIIQREDGVLRLVELGDGQVSDKKMWSADTFTQMILEHT